LYHISGASSPKFWDAKHFVFKRATVFGVGHRLLEPQNDKTLEIWVSHAPFGLAPPGLLRFKYHMSSCSKFSNSKCHI